MPAAPTATETLSRLAEEYWEIRLDNDPVEGTLLGDHRRDDRLWDPSPAARARQREVLRALRSRLDALPSGPLGLSDRVTRHALGDELDGDLAGLDCDLDAFTVDPRHGPQVAFLNLADVQPVASAQERGALLSRWRAMPGVVDQVIANQRRARGEGRLPVRGGALRVVAQLRDLLAVAPSDSVLWTGVAARLPAHLSVSERAAFTQALGEAVAATWAGFARWREALEREIVPFARDDAHAGLLHVPGGVACYARLVRVHTTLTMSADEIHRVGLADVERIRGEMRVLGEKVLGTGDVVEIQRRLRGDPALHFTTRDEVEAKATLALARAQAAFPRFFGRVPRTPCVVKRIEPYEEKDTTIAYYRQPAADGGRPGSYYINTYAPETRPRYEAEVLAFHESVPGHHSQIALAQEMQGLPTFRRHTGPNAFIEGWGLYAERLADEMGLYTGDLDRLGMLSFDAWRASRLVVDTGLHAMGWSRAQAEAYMLANTFLAPNNIANEVDRYINWPAQALAYKLGQREILRLRALAERRLGARFDLPSFHDAVLAQGAIGLGALGEVLDAWQAGVETAAAAGGGTR